jgi:hypothetical protein
MKKEKNVRKIRRLGRTVRLGSGIKERRKEKRQ